MIRAIIIDDDPKGRDFLTKIIARVFSDIRIEGTAADAQEGLQLIRTFHPQLVFLDVEMPGKSGFDLLNEAGEINFEVIFVTGHDEYALKAFRFNAVDYLLKPIDMDELETAVNRVRKKISDQSQSEVSNLRHFLSNLKNPFNKIGVPTQNGLLFLQLDEIVNCESESNYTVFHLTNKQKIIASKTLKEYEELLRDHNFFRVHKSHLINLIHIRQYLKGEGGIVMMSNGKEIDVSRQKKEEFLRLVKSRQ